MNTMKLKVSSGPTPQEPMTLRKGVKVWADTDSENRIINLVAEHKGKHTLVQVKNGKLCSALKKLVAAIG